MSAASPFRIYRMSSQEQSRVPPGSGPGEGRSLSQERSFDILRAFYDRLDAAESHLGGPYKRTAVGQYLPSPLRHLDAAIGYLIETSAFDPSGLFLDAGSGDGRVVALTSLVYGVPSVGVEYDKELVDSSKAYIESLKGSGLQGASDIIIPGDFTEDDTYLQAGLRFEDFATVFNYINNEGDIAEKVAMSAPPGTKLLVLGAFPVPGYHGLTLERNILLATGRDPAGGVLLEDLPVSDDTYIDLNATYIQVYRR